ncbi:MAG: Endoribonuclease YbeY [Pseudomonadota bacterium]
MNTRAYPELQLSLQWANPKAMAAHRALLPRHAVTRAIKHALVHPIAGQSAKKAVQAAEITVRVVGSEEGRALNQQYRGKDYATNVLTFDYALSPVLLADLVLCAPVLEREAAEQSKNLRAHYVHLLVHGTLHAMGYDHEHSQTDAAKMEALEILILQGLGMSNPYDA